MIFGQPTSTHNIVDSGNSKLQDLLTAAATGDESAFADLYLLASPKLYALLLRILRSRALAEDALQECFIRIWQNADRYDPNRGSPMAWLATIARYRALDVLRSRKAVPEYETDEGAELDKAEAPAQGPEDYAMQVEGMTRLDDCMQRLPAEHRDIVLLAYYQGCTHSEISQRMDTAVGTVKTWLYRGLVKLRDCLGTS